MKKRKNVTPYATRMQLCEQAKQNFDIIEAEEILRTLYVSDLWPSGKINLEKIIDDGIDYILQDGIHFYTTGGIKVARNKKFTRVSIALNILESIAFLDDDGVVKQG